MRITDLSLTEQNNYREGLFQYCCCINMNLILKFLEKLIILLDKKCSIKTGAWLEISIHGCHYTGPWLVRVRRVQLHPSIWGNGCMHPSIFRPGIAFRLFCLIFPANGQILHPSMEISNQGTAIKK